MNQIHVTIYDNRAQFICVMFFAVSHIGKMVGGGHVRSPGVTDVGHGRIAIIHWLTNRYCNFVQGTPYTAMSLKWVVPLTWPTAIAGPQK